MDNVKIGNLIKRLRTEKELTQLQLAQLVSVSDKAVSKWERGLGCPDLSLIEPLSRCFGIDAEALLRGELGAAKGAGDNVKNTLFYLCPECGNIIASFKKLQVSCCGKKLFPLAAKNEDEEHALLIETVEHDLFIHSRHEMKKDHFISFAALLSPDRALTIKLYPEWDMSLRIPCAAHGTLLWHCTKHGLFRRTI